MKVITGPETRWSYANVWKPRVSTAAHSEILGFAHLSQTSDTKTVAKIKAAMEPLTMRAKQS